MTEEVTPDKTVERMMKDSICHEARPEHIENTNTHSERPKSESDEFQYGEKVSNEEQQSQSSDFSNGLSVVVSPVSDNLQQGQSGQNLNTANYLLDSGKSIRTPSRYPDKALEDGYNWRKYGQKLVKGNEFVRSYYRCTHPSCRAKRQVERSRNGPITDTVYIGKHEHDKPQSGTQSSVFGVSPIQSMEPDVRPFAMEEDKPTNPRAPAPISGTQDSVVGVSPIQSMEPDVRPFATEEDKLTNPHAPAPKFHEAKVVSPQISSTTPTKNVLDDPNLEPKDKINHDGDQPLKKLKKEGCDVDEAPVEKPYGEPRFVGEPRVVQTISEVDLLQDGYRWRKYGQKLVKGNPNPRSYYRCSSSGCPAKKHVERASHDVKVVITTYEGQHDHGIPPSRTVTPNRGGSFINTSTLQDETRPEPEEKTTVGLDTVVHISAK